MSNSAKKIQLMGAKCIIITGASISNNQISDLVLEENKEYLISGKKISIINHGSGCNYSASITVSLAKGNTIYSAAKLAQNYVYQSIKNSKKIGKGMNITHKNIPSGSRELLDSINNFKQIKKLFFDYETIKSLGCGSIINLPVINNNRVLGTLNILHKERFYTKKSLKMIQPYAQLLSPYFILHQLKMKKKKK